MDTVARCSMPSGGDLLEDHEVLILWMIASVSAPIFCNYWELWKTVNKGFVMEYPNVHDIFI
jgi:hypothetical protein